MDVLGTWRLVACGAVFAASWLPAQVHAQARKVAIINLAADQSSGEVFASKARAALEKHPNLQPLDSGVFARSLENALPTADPADAVLAAAEAELDKAKAELAAFRLRKAKNVTEDAVRDLLTIAPSERQTKLLARLAFFAGRIDLREQNRGLARSAFELALRLDPEFPKPDPGRFNPDIVNTFRDAVSRTKSTRGGTLEVTSTPFDGATVFLNGREVGKTPLAISVDEGQHYVAVVSAEYRIAAQEVDVGDGDSEIVKFELIAVPKEDVAIRLRKQAIDAKVTVGGPDLVTAAKEFHDIADSSWVVIIRGTAGNLEATAFRANDSNSSPFRPAEQFDNVLAFIYPMPSPPSDRFVNLTSDPDPLITPTRLAYAAVGVLVVLGAVAVGVAASDDTLPGRPALPGDFR